MVDVSAMARRFHVEETLELGRHADERGGPHTVIGGLPSTESVPEAVAPVDIQMIASRFRGVRLASPSAEAREKLLSTNSERT